MVKFIILITLFLDTSFAWNRVCQIHAKRFEKLYGIPKMLLQAIALTESGKWDKKHSKHAPWPWAINSGGKDFFEKNKYLALQRIKELQKKNISNIDVGCMQINLHHHGHAFKSLHHSLNPRTNVEYAATFLKGLYEEKKSWEEAIAAYHSRDQEKGQRYKQKVLKNWHTCKQERSPKNISRIPSRSFPARKGPHSFPAHKEEKSFSAHNKKEFKVPEKPFFRAF